VAPLVEVPEEEGPLNPEEEPLVPSRLDALPGADDEPLSPAPLTPEDSRELPMPEPDDAAPEPAALLTSTPSALAVC
jgi:hypothetical protein